ncbi:aspartyl-tRNA synthetase [Mycoplasma testudineum]|uniref:Aspartate--tRNA ligase n=1 Tax=Mycoplasma testudineum TaxID=244584 RepID=A0A4R6IEY9_9MOLU|nr:aspartate--tRNA ligase [Mycoplasma testudineum]TDO20554.1 aspartyl-tRNA synthetase [Mycoplasma testudineum]
MKELNNGQINETLIDKKITVYGWAQTVRNFGKLTFVDLRDQSGIIQVVFNDLEIKIKPESVLKITGVLQKRKTSNDQIPTGKWEINGSEIQVINESDDLPIQINDEDNSKEDIRLKYRYLDLRKPSMHQKLTLRSKFFSALRRSLDSHGFLEIETPLLSKSTPEGARDFLVPTRKKGHFFSLPQSPQLYKQLLMNSGFEKYYQFAKVFRDEDSRKDRQPEFTQLDMEVSFKNPEYIKTLIEKIFKESFEAICHPIKIPFKRMDYDYAIENYGVDKPDLRFEYKIEDISDFFKNSKFDIIASKKTINGIFFDKEIDNTVFNFLEQVVQKNKGKILFYFNYKNKELTKSNFAKKDLSTVENLILKSSFESGSVLVVADDVYHYVKQALGAVRVELNNIFKLVKDENELNFCWIENWPLFEYNYESNTYGPMHHAFTMYDSNTLVNNKIDMEKTKALAYDLVLNGFEIGGGSQRIHDPKIQNLIFESIGLAEQQIQNQFGFFINSFKYGLPPHGGIAFGVDRIMMIITKSNSIRDVIAFPKNAKGDDLLSESPSTVTLEQLDELNLKIVEK